MTVNIGLLRSWQLDLGEVIVDLDNGGALHELFMPCGSSGEASGKVEIVAEQFLHSILVVSDKREVCDGGLVADEPVNDYDESTVKRL